VVHDLAVLGGDPAFPEPLHVGRPNIGEREAILARIGEVLDRRWLTNDGPLVRELEQRIVERTGARNCVAMANGTIALEIAIRALGLAGEVIVPSFTFVATAHALQWQQITPVFCDVDPRTHSIDPSRIASLLTPRTTGILGVHLWGRPCEVEALEALAVEHGLKLLFDAAHAFDCSHGGEPIGRFGNAEVFSFHATKFVNSFEGGAVVTNDDELAERMRLMRNFGFQGYDDVVYVGTNGKMSEVAAAMALTSLDSIEDFVAVNRRNHFRYRSGLAGLPGVHLLDPSDGGRSNYQYVVAEITDPFPVSRDVLMQVLWSENVRARRYFHPGVHRMEPYRSYQPNAGLLLPETERVAEHVLVLPTGTAMEVDHVDTVCRIIRTVAEGGEALAERLTAALADQAPELTRTAR
jgi:dTDP-4-amino-4,6-dideoxygalactose transaminase